MLPELSSVSPKLFPLLRNIWEQFTEADAVHIKATEKVTNHDVKAVEYFLKEKFEELGLNDFREFVHFGLTSQDINNTAIPLLLKEFIQQHYLPLLNELIKMIEDRAAQWKEIPMLARTHGQPASPTRLGKEMEVFSTRVKEQIKLLTQIPYAAKFGGATGNFNAHLVAYPEIDWLKFSNKFIKLNAALMNNRYKSKN